MMTPLRFEQLYQDEWSELEIAIGGGGFVDIVAAGGVFLAGSYDSPIASDQGSPIAARAAWTGSKVSYGVVEVVLPGTAAGQTVTLRWRVASDGVIGHAGYWVDTVEVTDPGDTYQCGGTPLICDDANVCTVDSCNPGSGCLSAPGNAGSVCRPGSGPACDPAEFCDGLSATCPPNQSGRSTAVSFATVPR